MTKLTPVDTGRHKCNVCQTRYPIGVAASPNGPMSLAYCRVCLQMGADAVWCYEGAALSFRFNMMGLAFFDQVTYLYGKYMPVGRAFAILHVDQLEKEFIEEEAKR